jgi:hypothetical protein
MSNCDLVAGRSLIDLAASRLALRAPALRTQTTSKVCKSLPWPLSLLCKWVTTTRLSTLALPPRYPPRELPMSSDNDELVRGHLEILHKDTNG